MPAPSLLQHTWIWQCQTDEKRPIRLLSSKSSSGAAFELQMTDVVELDTLCDRPFELDRHMPDAVAMHDSLNFLKGTLRVLMV